VAEVAAADLLMEAAVQTLAMGVDRAVARVLSAPGPGPEPAAHRVEPKGTAAVIDSVVQDRVLAAPHIGLAADRIDERDDLALGASFPIRRGGSGANTDIHARKELAERPRLTARHQESPTSLLV
jgi:hypothetical protein